MLLIKSIVAKVVVWCVDKSVRFDKNMSQHYTINAGGKLNEADGMHGRKKSVICRRLNWHGTESSQPLLVVVYVTRQGKRETTMKN